MDESYMVLYKACMINAEWDPAINVETPLYTTKEECIKHAEHLLKTYVSTKYGDDFDDLTVEEVPVYTHFDKNNKR